VVGLGPWSLVTHEGDTKVWTPSTAGSTAPLPSPEDGIRGQGKAVGTKTPTALLSVLRREK